MLELVKQAQTEQLASHASVLAQHTQTLVESLHEHSQRYADTSYARIKKQLSEHGAHMKEELMVVVSDTQTC